MNLLMQAAKNAPRIKGPLVNQAIRSLQSRPPTAMVSLETSIQNALRSGRGLFRGGAPSMLATAIGSGAVGYFSGDQDMSSFAAGAIGGLAGGSMLRASGGGINRMLSRTRLKNPNMSKMALGAVNAGRLLTSTANRRMLFAGGALLSGGIFSSLYGSNQQKTLKQGFNANRGSAIMR